MLSWLTLGFFLQELLRTFKVIIWEENLLQHLKGNLKPVNEQ